ncbi:MAG: dTMP kinase [Pseudonocardiaceae bacterium]
MFISFEGIDGAGKTTLSTALAHQLGRHGVDVVLFHKKSIPLGVDPYVEQHLATLSRLIWDEADHQPIHLLGDAHWVRLMAAYFAAISEVVIQPALAAGRTVVTDNWYYKFLARITVNTGCPQDECERVFDGILEPTDVVYLELDPSVAVARKSRFTRGEIGQHQRQSEAGDQGFVRYQSTVAEFYRGLAEERKWSIVRPEHETPEELANLVARDLGLVT